MAIELFRFDDNGLKLSKPEILLVSEFNALIDLKRNVSKIDPKGTQLNRAFTEFAYIYLYCDWKSVYSEWNEADRKEAAIMDSKIPLEWLEDPKMIAAIQKYKKLQDSRVMRLLDASYKACDELELFYNSVDLQERDPQTGKPIFSHKDVVSSLAGLGKLVSSLDTLIYEVKKEQQKNSTNRGDVQPGMFD
jgi:hypothetical protein